MSASCFLVAVALLGAPDSVGLPIEAYTVIGGSGSSLLDIEGKAFRFLELPGVNPDGARAIGQHAYLSQGTLYVSDRKTGALHLLVLDFGNRKQARITSAAVNADDPALMTLIVQNPLGSRMLCVNVEERSCIFMHEAWLKPESAEIPFLDLKLPEDGAGK